MKKKAIVIAGSRGIGKSIASELEAINFNVVSTSSKDLDTSKIDDVKSFIKKNKSADVLVLNTGGPPAKNFYDISVKDWEKYFNQIFLSFVLILQGIQIKKNGYVFLISSFHIKEPNKDLILSNTYRVALTSAFKSYGQLQLKKNITSLNLALGPIYTDRLKNLNKGKSKKEIGKNLLVL